MIGATDFHTARILIVDDEPVNVELMEQILEDAGYTNLICTTDPRQVLPLLRERRPDLIVLDLLMPHLDGFAVMDQLSHEIPDDTYLPILVLTADTTRPTRERALALGAQDFLTKPFDQDELLLRIRNLLRTRFLTLSLQEQQQSVERLYGEAREALRTRDAVLSAVSHDLGQPLTAVKMAAQMAGRRAAGASEAEAWVMEEMATISDSVTAMMAMIAELSDLARLQTGRDLDLHLRPTDLVALARRAIAGQQQLTDRHTISLHADAAALTGEWDDLRLVRVMTNLLTNAVKYSPGGGRITVTVTVEAGAAGHRGLAVLSVQDEGIGIPASELPRIGEPYYRATNVAGAIRGTGIGLTSSRQIVRQHGGDLTLVSVEGKGTVVTVRLPLE